VSSIGIIVFILLLAAVVWLQLQRDFIRGLSCAMFIWVSMTTFLRIDLPGSLPELTIHRLLLILVLIAWIRKGGMAKLASVPLLGYFAFWAMANLVSLAGTQIDFVISLKRVLDFVLEVFAAYIITATSLKTREDVLRVLRAAWLGLLVVAVFAVIERYTGFNPVDRYIPGYAREDVQFRDILSTFQHRILLGTALAMGVPLSFLPLRSRKRVDEGGAVFWGTLSLLVAGCYFSFSRGPWLGLALAFVILAFLGSTKIRSRLAIIGVIAGLILVVRPGVLETIGGFAKDTADTDSFKGGTFQYRLELWRVAASEVSKSAWTMLFGYGPGAGSVMEIERELSYRGRYQKIESWDNHFAYALFQSGYVGLLATLVLYLKALVPMLIAARNPGNPNRELQACLFAAAFVQVWMMTNVLVFAKQLDYLFWTLVASGFVLSSRAEFSRSPSAAPMPEHESGNDVEPSLSDVDCPQCKLTALSK